MPIRFRTARMAAALAAIGLLLLPACGLIGGSNSLAVLEWSGYEAEDFWTDFKTANPDTEVTFEFGDTDANILAQMQGGSQADIFRHYGITMEGLERTALDLML